jgi:hypothetical protein
MSLASSSLRFRTQSRGEMESDDRMSHTSRSETVHITRASGDSIVSQIAALLQVSTDDLNWKETVLDRVALLSAEQHQNPASTRYLEETIQMQNRRIAELEHTLKKSQKLCRTMESEIEEKVSVNHELTDQLTERQVSIEELTGLIHEFMAACDTLDSPGNAIAVIRRMKRQLLEQDSLDRNSQIEPHFRRLAETRRGDMEAFCDQIDHQGRLIHSALNSLSQKGQPDSDDQIAIEVCRRLEATNQLLVERMEQLRNARLYNLEGSDDIVPTRALTAPYSSDGLGPALWMARTREVLSLERQIQTVSRRLDRASVSCHVLAQENLRLQSSMKVEKGSTLV